MRDQDLDLIAALAAGDLTGVDASRAQELVARGGEYAAEFEAQQLALAALDDAGPTRLSDIERARLHKAVMAEVSGAPATAPATPPVEPRSIRWLRPLAVAAAAVVVVGFAGIVLNRGDGGAPAFSDMAASETTMLNQADDDAAASPTTSALAITEDVGGAERADSITDAAGEERAPAAPVAKSLDLGSVSSRDIDEQYLTEIYLGAAQFTRDAPGSIESTALSCAEAARELADEPLLAFGTAEYDGDDAQYFGFVSRRLLFLNAETCELLGEHP